MGLLPTNQGGKPLNREANETDSISSEPVANAEISRSSDEKRLDVSVEPDEAQVKTSDHNGDFDSDFELKDDREDVADENVDMDTMDDATTGAKDDVYKDDDEDMDGKIDDLTSQVGAENAGLAKEIELDGITPEKAKKLLKRLEMMRKLRDEVLKHPKIDRNIQLIQQYSRLGMPDWWGVPLDKAYLLAISKWGLNRPDLYVEDDQFPFKRLYQDFLSKNQGEPAIEPGKFDERFWMKEAAAMKRFNTLCACILEPIPKRGSAFPVSQKSAASSSTVGSSKSTTKSSGKRKPSSTKPAAVGNGSSKGSRASNKTAPASKKRKAPASASTVDFQQRPSKKSKGNEFQVAVAGKRLPGIPDELFAELDAVTAAAVLSVSKKKRRRDIGDERAAVEDDTSSGEDTDTMLYAAKRKKKHKKKHRSERSADDPIALKSAATAAEGEAGSDRHQHKKKKHKHRRHASDSDDGAEFEDDAPSSPEKRKKSKKSSHHHSRRHGADERDGDVGRNGGGGWSEPIPGVSDTAFSPAVFGMASAHQQY
ncbi:hypothetical protein HK405_013908 [Cladochytrium tenue]|nr:hypothetical protein HK405_013908 [Cladochytrium tenue]